MTIGGLHTSYRYCSPIAELDSREFILQCRFQSVRHNAQSITCVYGIIDKCKYGYIHTGYLEYRYIASSQQCWKHAMKGVYIITCYIIVLLPVLYTYAL